MRFQRERIMGEKKNNFCLILNRIDTGKIQSKNFVENESKNQTKPACFFPVVLFFIIAIRLKICKETKFHQKKKFH